MNSLSIWAHRALETGPDGRTFCAALLLIYLLVGLIIGKLFGWRAGPVSRAAEPIGYWISISCGLLLALYLVWDSVTHPAS
jgi:hypothetical protein